jgi:hypothetical protein
MKTIINTLTGEEYQIGPTNPKNPSTTDPIFCWIEFILGLGFATVIVVVLGLIFIPFLKPKRERPSPVAAPSDLEIKRDKLLKELEENNSLKNKATKALERLEKDKNELLDKFKELKINSIEQISDRPEAKIIADEFAEINQQINEATHQIDLCKSREIKIESIIRRIERRIELDLPENGDKESNEILAVEVELDEKYKGVNTSVESEEALKIEFDKQARVEAAKKELARVEVAKKELARVEAAAAERIGTSRISKELARVEAAKKELARVEVAKKELARVEAAERIGTSRSSKELARVEAARVEEARVKSGGNSTGGIGTGRNGTDIIGAGIGKSWVLGTVPIQALDIIPNISSSDEWADICKRHNITEYDSWDTIRKKIYRNERTEKKLAKMKFLVQSNTYIYINGRLLNGGLEQSQNGIHKYSVSAHPGVYNIVLQSNYNTIQYDFVLKNSAYFGNLPTNRVRNIVVYNFWKEAYNGSLARQKQIRESGGIETYDHRLAQQSAYREWQIAYSAFQ